MKTKINTAPTTEPVTLEEAKRHLRLAVSAAQASGYSEEDEWFTRNIAAARRMIEQELGRVFITQTWDVYYDEWPSVRFIELPYPPLVSAAVTYRLEDDAGYTNTFTDIITDIVEEPGQIVLTADGSWPSGTLYPVNPIKVEIVCGYGVASAVPSGIKSAILLKLSDLHEERGDTIVGPSFKNLGAIDSLIQQYRMWGPR